MAKERTTAFFCSECGAEFAKWMGQCPSCKAWNTLVEEPVSKSKAKSVSLPGKTSGAKPATLTQIDLRSEDVTGTGIGELDRVLGGGIVPGSLVLIGGDRKVHAAPADVPDADAAASQGALCVRRGVAQTDQNACHAAGIL